MSEIDKLLTQLKAEYEKPAPSQVTAKETSAPTTPIKPQSQSSSPLDSLLAEVKAEFDTQESPPKPQARQKPTPEIPRQSPSVTKVENSVLQELQAEFQEQERAEVQRQQVQLKEQQRLEEQRQQRRRQALQQQAQEWLKRLNPKSEEGRWFEEFAYSYASKLEAAIDYLEALRESGLNQ